MPPLAAPDPMHQARLEKKRMRYRLNREIEREKARLRAQRRKDLPAEQRDVLAESHRRAQARYREKNRDLLNVHACKYRIQKKAQKAILDDEEEYQRLWALAGEELEGIR